MRHELEQLPGPVAPPPAGGGTAESESDKGEAVRYFEQRRVWKIVLNTEEENHRAHALYEWFGFQLIEPRGFVLGREIAPGEPRP